MKTKLSREAAELLLTISNNEQFNKIAKELYPELYIESSDLNSEEITKKLLQTQCLN